MNKRGSFVTAQRPVKMFWQHVAISHLPNFSCATFFRRTMLERQGAWFDPRFRYCGDQQWTLERLRFGTPEIRIRDITSVFWDHGNNAGTGPAGLAEAASIRQAAPGLVRQLAWLWKWCHRLVKLFSGKYFPVQVRALVYAGAEARQRSMIAQGWASPVWLRRLLQQRTTLGNQPPSGPGDFAN